MANEYNIWDDPNPWNSKNNVQPVDFDNDPDDDDEEPDDDWQPSA